LKENFELNEIIIEYLNGIVISSERHGKDSDSKKSYDSLIQLLDNITKHLHATETVTTKDILIKNNFLL